MQASLMFTDVTILDVQQLAVPSREMWHCTLPCFASLNLKHPALCVPICGLCGLYQRLHLSQTCYTCTEKCFSPIWFHVRLSLFVLFQSNFCGYLCSYLYLSSHPAAIRSIRPCQTGPCQDVRMVPELCAPIWRMARRVNKGSI